MENVRVCWPYVATGYCKSETYSKGGAIATTDIGSRETVYFLVINNVCCTTKMCRMQCNVIQNVPGISW